MSEHEEWLARARSCLALAGMSVKGDIRAEDLCFQAQQAAEKSLKALLSASGRSIPRTHDLVALLRDAARYYAIPEPVKDVVELNDYAVQTRYPGDYTPVTASEHADAVAEHVPIKQYR